MKKARLAVIGTGDLAQSQHLPNIRQSKLAELAALCDLNHELLQRLGRQYPSAKQSTDYQELLADPGIDGVVIATREDTHVPLTVEALQAGKHVYVEKPLAETPEECNKVVEARAASGKCVIVGMNRRCAPAYVMARNLLLENGGARNLFYRIADTYSFGWGKRFGQGNRMLHELCHIFDILRYFADSEVAEVYCRSQRDDDESILLTFHSGCTACILSSGFASYTVPKEHFEVIAEAGMLIVEEFVELRSFGLSSTPDLVKFFPGHSHPDHNGQHVQLFAQKGYPALLKFRGEIAAKIADPSLPEAERKTLPLLNYSVDKGWQGAIDHFADIILNGSRQYAASEIDGLRASEITTAALKSRQTKKPVTLPQ
ncbi:MAG: Gfo/Idh/MocA family oxidoreductase [Lentisphaerae bacterium]|nr:Gfo/Idh/MocA family oxidoreductase [Lentisphaerota bacterium]OQC11696.1 MAG: Inositol 2-dehydrogenase/D-chiro-inositol 3-dehydrogenase [Lentisphaerae bacterium ADurb.Bin082]